MATTGSPDSGLEYDKVWGQGGDSGGKMGQGSRNFLWGCRCGQVHMGAYALEEWGRRQCLHEEEFTGVEVEKWPALSQWKVQVTCPGCGQSWIARIEDLS